MCTSKRPAPPARLAAIVPMLIIAALGGCAAVSPSVAPGTPLQRHGDEIIIAGQAYRTGAPVVVLWTDPGGYDAYRTEYRFEPFDERRYDPNFRALNGPQRYNMRQAGLSEEERELVRGGGWPLELLQREVDQFVIHYDVCGTSQRCFDVLHDHRGLSVHFMLDIDGTIYQTLDVKERAWHASQANTRSVGIEIANIGAYSPDEPETLERWYGPDADGRTRITLPSSMGDGGVRTPDFVGYPSGGVPISGEIHGTTYEQYDLTPEQYDSLIRLTATLCTVLPRIRCDYPRNDEGTVLTTVMPDEQWQSYGGLIGHFHLTTQKIDPGPAFDWDRVVDGAKELMR
ncbi:MAG: N-acetylmuramoyl-L-alanine amidase [Planctomycetota bacterium]